MLFRRKNEFRPDRPYAASFLSRLYITKKQRLTIGKWLLMALVLVILSVVQDVILSRVTIFGAKTDLVSAAILMVCIMLDPEIGCVFTLVSSALYEFSGSAPGAYVIALITFLGLLLAIFRHSFLRAGFGAEILCTAAAVMLYQLSLFAIGYFLGHTTASRLPDFCVTGLLSLAVMPALYPIFSAISNIGGETWRE
jgi:hypothetical protein